MIQQIEKLKETREKLTVDYKNNQTEYKAEIKRIDRTIKSFEKGMSELNGTTVKPKRVKSYSEIEKILSETGQLHVKEIVRRLNERGIPMSYQSASGLLQLYSKSGKIFTKTAPATYALIEQPVKVKKEANKLEEENGEGH